MQKVGELDVLSICWSDNKIGGARSTVIMLCDFDNIHPGLSAFHVLGLLTTVLYLVTVHRRVRLE